jgi:hypothetical protein
MMRPDMIFAFMIPNNILKKSIIYYKSRVCTQIELTKVNLIVNLNFMKNKSIIYIDEYVGLSINAMEISMSRNENVCCVGYEKYTDGVRSYRCDINASDRR